MGRWVTWALVAIALLAADRALLALESRGWINYRRNGPNDSAARYHLMEMSSVWEPGTQQVAEVRYAQRKKRSHAGDPPGEDDGGTNPVAGA